VLHERDVEGLPKCSKEEHEAIERTEQGIKQLLREGRAVNFKTVAEVAGFLLLGFEPQIKERIEHLRQQQVERKSLPPKQRASPNFSQTCCTNDKKSLQVRHW